MNIKTIAFLFASATVLAAQAAPAVGPAAKAPPASDVVASVKPVAPGARVSFNIRPFPGGGIDAEGAELSQLVFLALNVQSFQVQGVPRWATNTRYDVEAKRTSEAPDNVGDSRAIWTAASLTLQTVLVQRFGLTWHWSSRNGKGYKLVVYKNHLKLPAAQGDEVEESRRNAVPAAGLGNGLLVGKAATTGTIAGVLSGYLKTKVLDETGLIGRYDFTLKWTPLTAAPVSPGAPPDLFTAIREQLGLELKPATVSMPALVIDSIHRPTPN